MIRKIFSVVLTNFLIILNLIVAQQVKDRDPLPYQNPDLSIDERVNDLLSRMTLDEKISQMVNDARPIERLGIPAYNWWSEGLHGVAFSGVATVFPQSIGLAAMWDDSLMLRVAEVIGIEFRAKCNEYQQKGEYGPFRGLTVWSPNINIFRDPRWGRGQETYGEDPYLTSRMGVAYVKGMQGNDPKYFRVICTPKHYAVHSGPEPERHHFNAVTNYRDLLDTYTPAFKACIVEGGAYSVMCAYNRYLGVPCCASEFLLTKVLREKWGFKGYVVSDCGAIYDIFINHKYVNTPEEAAALAVKAGCDLECGDAYQNLKKAVEKGLISESDIDVAVKRLLTARFKLGHFDLPEMVPYAKISPLENDKPEHRQLALEAARKSIVLLKNKDNLLPLRKTIHTIAVIGPNANVVEVLYGNYNGVSSKAITPLEGIKNRAPENVKILYEPGCNVADNSPVLMPIEESFFLTEDGKTSGLNAEYFDNMSLEGKPFLTRIDNQVNFDFVGNPPLPKKYTRFSVRWTGWLVPPENDVYHIGFLGDDGFRVYLDDKLILDDWRDHVPEFLKTKVELKKGKRYRIRVEYYQNAGAAIAKLQWGREKESRIPKIEDVVKQADIVVYVGGITPMLEGEEMKIEMEGFYKGDRTSLDLPKVQEDMLKRIKSFGKPVVLVLLNGSALSINWANENVDAIIEAWYPGEEGGNAIADVLFGNYNPAGRLPVTFYASVNDLPPFEDYNMKGRTYRYFEGKPLYEFGYGLSYTTFRYSNLVAPDVVSTRECIKVSVDVQNVGNMDGEEVIQLYVKILDANVPVPRYALQGFKRVFLKVGEKKKIELELKPEQFSIINSANQRVVEPGKLRIYVGGRQPSQDALDKNLVLSADVKITGETVLIE